MYKYKFLNMLDSLSDKEFKTLGKFINSPYFNESKHMAGFYEFIKKYYHNHTFDMVTTELISSYIFKTKKFNSVRTRKLISDFNNLIENFLVHYSLDKDIIGKKAYLTNQLKNKELVKFYNNEIDEIKELMNNSQWDSKNYYYTKLKLVDEEFLMKKFDMQTDKKISTVKNLVDSADQLYIFIRLYIFHLLVQNNLMGESKISEYGLDTFEKLMGNIENNIDKFESKQPRIYLCYLTLKLIKLNSLDKVYQEIENYIEKNRVLLNTKDVEYSVYTIVSHIVNEITTGKYEKINIAVRVFKRIDEKGFFNNIREINHFTFIQIIIFALHIKDIEYA
ncbi:MAG: hypothetical protein WC358_10495, partial [Ignavibacteria bacterium]